jgi:photosystem II stability/assembly factor-like uncharacterized protein
VRKKIFLRLQPSVSAFMVRRMSVLKFLPMKRLRPFLIRGNQNMRIRLVLISFIFIFFSSCSKNLVPGEWVFLDTGTGDFFASANFVDERTGWLNGHTDRSSIEVEENENSNRSPKRPKPEEKKDPLKENQGFEVLQTTDGGETWKQIPDQFKHKIRSVWFVDPQTGWALTIDRDILHTWDGGVSWSLQRKAGRVKVKLIGNRRQPEMEQPDQIDHIYFIDSTRGWAWGGGEKSPYTEQPGIFLTTIDGGQNWNAIPFPFENKAASLFFLDAQHSWASVMDGTFYKSADGGLNWTKIETKLPEDKMRAIFFIDENNGWVATMGGRLARTTDGGRTWRKMWEIKEEYKMRDVFFTDRNHGWAVGDEGAILYTWDGGETWVVANAPLPSDFIDVLFVSSRAGWAVGHSGAAHKFVAR